MDPAAEEVIPPARVRLRGDQPYSLDFDDIYHAVDGAAEVDRVFIAPCGLVDLARRRSGRGPNAVVRVAELGFGSGLNFVVTAQRCLTAGVRLHFVSFEAHPLDAAIFRSLARTRSAAHPLYRALNNVYPPRLRGWHQRSLAGGRICLSLWFGDAGAGLADLHDRQRQPMDAWYLDGFAPDRNAALWEPSLLAAVGALCRQGTRVATFTAAGRVRRALEAAGFAMARIDQRPHKRESLAGSYVSAGLPDFTPPAAVTVAGGGLAGAAVACQLARAGFQVQVFDAPPDGQESNTDSNQPASSIPATVLHARLLADGSPVARLRSRAYLHATAEILRLPGFEPGGALQLATDEDQASRLLALAARYRPSGAWLSWLDADQAEAWAAWPAPLGGLYLPGGGRVNTPALVSALLRHPAIERVPERVPERVAERVAGEVPAGHNATAAARPVVLACGAAVRRFPPARHLEVAAVQGQIDLVQAAARPRLPIVGSSYLVPADGLLAAGSTYEYRPWAPGAATRANLEQLAGHPVAWRQRYRGTRCVSSDRTAIAGRLHARDGTPVEHWYVSAGHGSAGNVSVHLAASVITALLLGDCPPLERDLEYALAPLRFRDRQARRGYRLGAAD